MLTEHQQQIIEQQLGRKPRGIAEIAYATDTGLPVVLRMRSLVDEQPFPTLYWLCSRDLYKAIARLETDGWVKRLEEELAEDSDFRQRYQQSHQQYVGQRWHMMTSADKQRIEELGFSKLFDRYGIGGIAQWDKVRCLHMHYAHYLAQRQSGEQPRNAVVERLEAEFELTKLQLTL
ncbi:MAG: DUF501 domain-containing protein [Motiliproteus sp.]|nr:DUF501 domain-containing protein [Motiliproteus sp.]MCW9054210.1 DUF501 domain-containing protein [Motiliproteus sp.]